jgi:DNA-directed RNA polymerase specialized sigma24 family protein
VRNQVIDEIRRSERRPTNYDVPESYPDSAPSPLEQTIRIQGLERYRAAPATLSALDRALIVERLDHERSYEEVASAVGKPNAAAARMAISRALLRLIAAFERQARAGASACWEESAKDGKRS